MPEPVELIKRMLKAAKFMVYEFIYPDGRKSIPFVSKQLALVYAKEKNLSVIDKTED